MRHSIFLQTTARDRIGCSALTLCHSHSSFFAYPPPAAAADIVAALALNPPAQRRLTWPASYLNMCVRGHPCLRFLVITDGCADSDRLLQEQLQARAVLCSSA